MKETKVTIKGIDYTIKFVDTFDLCHGMTDTTEKIILINYSLEKNLMFEAILHELIHAYFYECGLDCWCDDEKLVTFIARHFFDVNEAFYFILKNENLNMGDVE